jgi:hypothetical protein
MKKLMALSLICILGNSACSKKVVPVTGTTTTKIETAKAEPVKTEAQTLADIEAKKKLEPEQPAQETAAMTPMDQGKTVFTTKCGKCHALKNTGDYTPAQWDNILKAMSPRARLSSDEEKRLVMYIKANAKQ